MTESYATSDIRTDTNCIDFFTYKIVNYGNPLRIYRIMTEKTENSNELLIKYKLIHTCNCTSEEWCGENPKFTADIEQIIYKDVRSIRWQDDLQLCGKWYEKQYGLYSAHVKYLHVEVYEDW